MNHAAAHDHGIFNGGTGFYFYAGEENGMLYMAVNAAAVGSGMVNCGIDNISVIVRKNYRSLLRHLGSGREWDLTRKHGGLNIVPPFAEKTVKVYNGRVEALASILEFLKMQREKYVVISDANIVANFDFNAMIDAHAASGADVTIAYKKEEIPYGFMNLQPTLTTDLYYTLNLEQESGRVTQIKTNPKEHGPQNFSMNIYLIDRELLIVIIVVSCISIQFFTTEPRPTLTPLNSTQFSISPSMTQPSATMEFLTRDLPM